MASDAPTEPGQDRPLKLHTGSPERTLCLFRADKPGVLAFGAPRRGAASIVCRGRRVFSACQFRIKITRDTRKGYPGLSGRSGGIRYRSLNLHTGSLERTLCSFRANKLGALAFGTPHRGAASLVCRGRRGFSTCQFRIKITRDTRKGYPGLSGRSGGIRRAKSTN